MVSDGLQGWNLHWNTRRPPRLAIMHIKNAEEKKTPGTLVRRRRLHMISFFLIFDVDGRVQLLKRHLVRSKVNLRLFKNVDFSIKREV